MKTVIENKLLEDLKIRHKCHVPLGPLTWYGVGGAAAAMAHPASVQQLSALAAKTHGAGVPVYILGSGANLLVDEKGVDGIVVQLDDPCFKTVKIEGNLVTAGAGADLAKLVLQTAKAGLSGLEGLAGIPATIGGAVRMNAGGAFGEIGGAGSRVMVCADAGQVYYRDRDDLVFSYRKTNIVARYILEVEFELTPDDPDDLMRRVKEIFLFKKNSQPLADCSAGCAFKNPREPREEDTPGEPRYIPAGKLIDQSGLKCFRIGGAEVSPRHANFIVAHPGCTAADVLAVLKHVRRVVYDRTGITLEREVVVWP